MDSRARQVWGPATRSKLSTVDNVRRSVPIMRQLTDFWSGSGTKKKSPSPSKAHTVDKDGNTLLHWEAFKKQCDESALVSLLEDGVDVDAQNNEGLTALHLGACVRSKRTTEILLKYGADLEVADPEGHTALHWAVKRNTVDVTQVLLRAGGRVATQNQMGYTVLHDAAGMNLTKMLEILLKSAVDLDATTLEGHTALHWATMCGHEEAVQLLLKAGADANAVSKAGHTPLFLAMRSDHDGCVKALTQYGASMDDVLRVTEQQERVSREISFKRRDEAGTAGKENNGRWEERESAADGVKRKVAGSAATMFSPTTKSVELDQNRKRANTRYQTPPRVGW